MSLPGNGIFVVLGEMAMLVTAMRRSTRWGSHSFPNEEYDVLMRTFQDLKSILQQVEDLRLLDPSTYLSPFLEVIRSKETTGPVTSLALSAINKFLSYGLIDPTHPSVPATVEDVADAVTHARFVGTDHSSDGVVLMKILQVLRTLMLSPEGAMLTDESVCEIMLSCFRICFETRLTELLRRNAEQYLRDMTQLIFMRLPQFATEEFTPGLTDNSMGLSLKKRDKPSRRTRSMNNLNQANTDVTNISESTTDSATKILDMQGEILGTPDTGHLERKSQTQNYFISEAEITIELPEEAKKSSKNPIKKHGRQSSMDLTSNENNSISQLLEKCVGSSDNSSVNDEATISEKTYEDNSNLECEIEKEEAEETPDVNEIIEDGPNQNLLTDKDPQGVVAIDNKLAEEYVNPRGIRFTKEDDKILQPYGIVCVRELFRFLISLCNPHDPQNTSAMVHLGLCLVGTALEVGADNLAQHPTLRALVKDPLCRNLLSLLNSDRISIFALDLQISFLLFEALRPHLKLQMEAFFMKLIEIISADTTKSIYELKEITHLSLEALSQMFRIPGLCTEMFLNYDCDIYCTNLFEDLTKLLSKNVVSSTAYNIHTLSLDALMTIIESIEANCNQKASDAKEAEPGNGEGIEKEGSAEVIMDRGTHISLEMGGMDDSSVLSDHVVHDISQYLTNNRVGRHRISTNIPSENELDDIKNRKRWIAIGTEIFNQKAENGITYLQEHEILQAPMDPRQVAMFLRENPSLDKKMIGEYICKRTSTGDEGAPTVMAAFADSFEFTGLRIDQALRLYLEAFRLPGEAPLIFLIMEHFAERWHNCNGCPFANADAAFRLAYAVIMLNMDQHNHNAKKLNVPMVAEEFVRNLRSCNGSGDFDREMLKAVFNSIKNEEIVMPAERTGLVKENYLWKVLLRRSAGPGGTYLVAPPTAYQHRLFALTWGPTVTALSAAFERAPAPTPEEVDSPTEQVGAEARADAAARALAGLEACAGVVAQLRPRLPAHQQDISMDTLILTMCKFTGLLNLPEQTNYTTVGVTLGQSSKARLALVRVCSVLARHADCVAHAWKHVLEMVRALFLARLLPKNLTEVEDLPGCGEGRVCLAREAAAPRAPDAGLLSSLYSYIAAGEARAPGREERAAAERVTRAVQRCSLHSTLVTETKFLRLETLQELVKRLIAAGTPPDTDVSLHTPDIEDEVIFFTELLVKTVIQNRDRVLQVWAQVSAHLARVLQWGGARGEYAAERALCALFRSAVRLMRSEDCAPTVLQALRSLFQLPYRVFYQHSERIASGLYELVKTSAQNMHSAEEWGVALSLLSAAGAGAWPATADETCATPTTGYGSASSRSEGAGSSEDEGSLVRAASDSELSQSPASRGWIVVGKEGESDEAGQQECSGVLAPPGAGVLREARPAALARCAECAALVVRDVAHVTPYNFTQCVACIRTLAEASLLTVKKTKSSDGKRRTRTTRHRMHNYDSDDSEEDTSDQTHIISLQLLDLMHTLHSRTAHIFRWWREEAGLLPAADLHYGGSEELSDLWEVAWMPLLQGMARMCTDRRKQVWNCAVTYLQRALLAPGLQALGGAGWEACFARVLFPLAGALLPRRAPTELTARANTIMCKVFLHHLSALAARAAFPALWLRVVALQLALAAPAAADSLREAALESLKNMILVMDSVKIFSNGEGYTELWHQTWKKIDEYFPHLKEELFPQQVQILPKSVAASEPQPVTMPEDAEPLVALAASAPAPSPPARNPLYTALPTSLLPTTQTKGSSIILQPPASSAALPPLFSHLGQMVSSPIGFTATTVSSHPQIVPFHTLPSPLPPTSVLIPPLPVVPGYAMPSAPPLQHFTLVSPNPTNNQLQLETLRDVDAKILPRVPNPSHDPSRFQNFEQSNNVLPSYMTSPLNVGLAPVLSQKVDLSKRSHVEASSQPDSLYSEYITNPYNNSGESSRNDSTTEEQKHSQNSSSEEQTSMEIQQNTAGCPPHGNPNIESTTLSPVANAKIFKSVSVTSSPFRNPEKPKPHAGSMMFGSSDNIHANETSDQTSGIFNFSNYFASEGRSIPPGSEILFGDNFLPSPEG